MLDKNIERTYLDEARHEIELALYAAVDLNEQLDSRDSIDSVRMWYAAQAFLVATGMISNLLWNERNPSAERRSKHLRRVLDIGPDSRLRSRAIRNAFVHFDERLDTLAARSEMGENLVVFDRNIFNPDFVQINIPGFDSSRERLRHIDPARRDISILGETVSVPETAAELEHILGKIHELLADRHNVRPQTDNTHKH